MAASRIIVGTVCVVGWLIQPSWGQQPAPVVDLGDTSSAVTKTNLPTVDQRLSSQGSASGYVRVASVSHESGSPVCCGTETACGGCGSESACGCDCCCDETCWFDDLLSVGDHFKDMPLDCCGNSCCSGCCDPLTLSFGGSLRYRYMNEANRLRPMGDVNPTTYDLWRWTNYLELNRGDEFSVFVEMIDASIFNEDLPRLPIDENRTDILRAYVDLKIGERDGNPVRLRVGRQFLKYGSQHLVSPLPWANTIRNWDGLTLSSQGATWDLDAFATRPANWATSGNKYPTSHDKADQSQTFSGVYTSYHPGENSALDTYWFWLREQEPRANRMDGSRHTIGMRYWGSHPVVCCCGDVARTWAWDIEGGYQFGHDNDLAGVEQNVSAGFFSAVLGHTWNQATWTPTVKGLFWWGSGDNDPTSGDINTIDTLFPFGHAYWGLIDNFGGENLEDYSLQATVKPTDKLTLLSAMHWFNLAEGNDRVYNVVGAPLGTGSNGSNLGQEFDVVGTYAVNKNLNVQAGYFWFWYGNAINSGSLARGDARTAYLQTVLTY